MKESRDFKGVWIPKEIWLNKTLTLQEKVFLIEIDSLDNKDGCFATNAHFSEFFGVSKSRCTQVIKSLEDKGLISIELNRLGQNTTKRVLKVFNKLNWSFNKLNWVSEETKQANLENAEYNNTIPNNTNNSTLSGKSKNGFSPQVHWCYNDCIRYFPEHLQPKTEAARKKWFDTIEKLNRIDKIPFEVITQIVKETREDDFWKTNFMSILKLRKKNKDDVLYVQYFYERMKNKSNNGATTQQQKRRDDLARLFAEEHIRDNQ